jgi:hypothetical protein
METRQQFISRMIWMVREINSSKFNSLDSLPMLELELKARDKDLMRKFGFFIIDFIHSESSSVGRRDDYKNHAKTISLKTEVAIKELIKKLE